MEGLTIQVAVATAILLALAGTVVLAEVTEQTVVSNTQVESVVMDLVGHSTYMVEEVTDTVLTTLMVTIPLEEDIGVEVNQRLTLKETMDTITKGMLPGVLVETELEKVIEVLLDDKESLLFTNSTDK